MDKIKLQVINNEYYEDSFEVGDILFAEKALYINANMIYYKICGKGFSNWDYAWFDSSRFQVIE